MLPHETAIHPGLVWRFGAHSLTDRASTYRDEQVQLVCHKASAAMRGPLAAAHGDLYRAAFLRRQDWLRGRAACRSIALASRLEIGIGEPSVFECQVALHPVSGMPRLAGSGLKGLLRHWLFKNQARLPEQERRQLTKDKLEALFGNDADSPRPVGGLLTVHDAWWDPASTRGPLEAERATSHLPGEDGQAAEFRGPNPVPRIAVAGTMLFAIDHDAVGDVWASRCLDWLHHALADEGAGAARQQGYGRFVSPTAS